MANADAKNPQSNFRLSAEGREILKRLANHYGINQTATLELVLREMLRDIAQNHPKIAKGF